MSPGIIITSPGIIRLDGGREIVSIYVRSGGINSSIYPETKALLTQAGSGKTNQ